MNSSPIQMDSEISQALPIVSTSSLIEEIPTSSQEVNTELQLWKLFKPKFMLQFKLCSTCLDKLFHSPSKAIKDGSGKVTVKVELCKDCVLVNLKATDLLAPKKKN